MRHLAATNGVENPKALKRNLRLSHFKIWALGIVLGLFTGFGVRCWADDGEERLLLLHNGGRVCGIAPQIGGRVFVFRTDAGKNVLDARPNLWSDVPPRDLTGTSWKQYFGESVWAGPQSDWWTSREPYPPHALRAGTWPPDPAWELAPVTILEKTGSRVVMRGPVSAITGLQLTKTVELLADGRLKIQERAVNCGDRAVTRDLWLLHRVPPRARCILPLESESEDRGFVDAAAVQKWGGLTVIEPKASPARPKAVSGKLLAVAKEGWMASAFHNEIFIVKFRAVAPNRVALGHAALEVFLSSSPSPLCEMEHHGELKTLKPGESMENEESWQIVPYSGPDTAESEANFLQAR